MLEAPGVAGAECLSSCGLTGLLRSVTLHPQAAFSPTHSPPPSAFTTSGCQYPLLELNVCALKFY